MQKFFMILEWSITPTQTKMFSYLEYFFFFFIYFSTNKKPILPPRVSRPDWSNWREMRSGNKNSSQSRDTADSFELLKVVKFIHCDNFIVWFYSSTLRFKQNNNKCRQTFFADIKILNLAVRDGPRNTAD